jgi:hypothetical protein
MASSSGAKTSCPLIAHGSETFSFSFHLSLAKVPGAFKLEGQEEDQHQITNTMITTITKPSDSVTLGGYTNGSGKAFPAFRSKAGCDQEAADIVHRMIESGKMRDTKFAQSCVDSWVASVRSRSPRPMSSVMRYWLHKIASPDDAPAPEQIDLTRINQMFSKAKLHLKRPGILLSAATAEVKISIAGGGSRYKDQVIVAAPKFGQGYYGRIDLYGQFLKTNAASPDIVELVRAFSADPEAVAAAHGKLTGKCCFCNRPLCDDRSTEVDEAVGEPAGSFIFHAANIAQSRFQRSTPCPSSSSPTPRAVSGSPR